MTVLITTTTATTTSQLCMHTPCGPTVLPAACVCVCVCMCVCVCVGGVSLHCLPRGSLYHTA